MLSRREQNLCDVGLTHRYHMLISYKKYFFVAVLRAI